MSVACETCKFKHTEGLVDDAQVRVSFHTKSLPVEGPLTNALLILLLSVNPGSLRPPPVTPLVMLSSEETFTRLRFMERDKMSK